MKLLSAILLLGLPTLASAASLAPAAQLVVLPFAPVGGALPVRAGVDAAAMLAEELSKHEGLDVRALAPETDPAKLRSLHEARARIAAARGHEEARRFHRAASEYREALGRLEAAAGALEGPAELSDTHAALGIALQLSGDDEGATTHLLHALTLSPDRPLLREGTSRLFDSLLAALRARISAAPTGSVRVESSPPGSAVVFDGRSLGRTPLLIKEIPAGKHLCQVLVPSSERAGSVLEVAPGRLQLVSAPFPASTPTGRLVAAATEGRLDDNLTTLAAEAAAGSSGVVFGAIVGSGDQLVLAPLLYLTGPRLLLELPRHSFDRELLSAGIEVFKLAGELAPLLEQPPKTGARLPTLFAQPAPPAAEARVAEVVFAGARRETGEPAAAARRPIDPNRPVRALRPREGTAPSGGTGR